MSQVHSSCASGAESVAASASSDEAKTGFDANVSVAANSSSETFYSLPPDEADAELGWSQEFDEIMAMLAAQENAGNDNDSDALPPLLSQGQGQGHGYGQLQPLSLFQDPVWSFNPENSEASVVKPKQSPDPLKERNTSDFTLLSFGAEGTLDLASSQNQNESQPQSENADSDSDSD